jgi:hypothetical protein
MLENKKVINKSYQFYLQLLNKLLWSRGRYNYMARTWANEVFLYSFVDEWQQGVVVSIHIQQPHLQEWLFNTIFIIIMWSNQLLN